MELNWKVRKGIKVGIMQPYLKVSFGGHLSLMNHNPHNVIIKTDAFESILRNLKNSKDLIKVGNSLLGIG